MMNGDQRKSLEWLVSDNPSDRLAGLPDPRAGELRSGDFRCDLAHEFGHWLAAQERSFRVEFLGLYGLEYDESRIRITRGGIVVWSSAIAGDFQWAVVAVAGVVAERLRDGTYRHYEAPASIFSGDPTLQHDWNKARRHLIADAARNQSAVHIDRTLRTAVTTAAEIVRPHIERINANVLQLEAAMLKRRSETMVIEWSGPHAALLTGNRSDYYEVRDRLT